MGRANVQTIYRDREETANLRGLTSAKPGTRLSTLSLGTDLIKVNFAASKNLSYLNGAIHSTIGSPCIQSIMDGHIPLLCMGAVWQAHLMLSFSLLRMYKWTAWTQMLKPVLWASDIEILIIEKAKAYFKRVPLQFLQSRLQTPAGLPHMAWDQSVMRLGLPS